MAIKSTPRKYQLRAAKFLVERGAAALFLDPGLGKTWSTLAAFLTLRKKKLAKKALVVAPLRVVYSVWPKEVEKWREFNDLRVSIVHGPKKLEALEADADLYVINPEGLTWLFSKLTPRKLKAKGIDVLVLDELSKFKNTRTQRFKALRAYLSHFDRRWGLTGTPAANGLLDLFGQAFALDMGRSLGLYYSHFRMKYFRPLDSNGWAWAIKAGAEEDIYKRLRPLALRMSAEEFLDLPPLTFVDIAVDLPVKARRVYDQMEAALVALLDEEKVVSVTHAAAASTKCRQIASGGLYDDTEDRIDDRHRSVTYLHTAKIEALRDLGTELQGAPLLIAYEFQHEIEPIKAMIKKEFGVVAPHVGAGVSATKTDVIISAWNRGEIPFLIAHPASLGHGVNLQERANHVCFFSITWNLELYDQFMRRVYRQGVTGKVFVYHIIANDTVDEVILEALDRKDGVQRALLDGIQGRAKRGKKAC